jgi:arsenate reductase (thioredoxin)
MIAHRILFVCVGNAYRSQMAEGFMRAYAGRSWEVVSAGVSPASRLPPETVAMMKEKGIDVSGHFPKSLSEVLRTSYEVIINMSGVALKDVENVVDWAVEDPLGADDTKFRKVRDEIEQRVQRLVVALRQPSAPASPPPSADGTPCGRAESPFRRRPDRKWDPEGWRRGN